jgi:hypothetical protein
MGARVTVYDERAVVLAYVDAQRPPYPHEDFRRHRQARLRALEEAYGISVSQDGARASGALALWMLFSAAVSSYLGLRSPREGFSEDGLINVKIEGLGAAGQEIRAVEERLRAHLEACREAHLELLTKLFVGIWGPIDRPLKVGDLQAYSFDEATEPTWLDYVDEI